jgi:hypothetical protein
MTSDFVTIPPELQVWILQNLDAVSLVHCAMVMPFHKYTIYDQRAEWTDSQTCVYLNDLVKNSSQLMYIIHLHWDGLKDCGTAPPNADSVALLLQRRQAWLSLEWMRGIPSEIPDSFGDGDAWGIVRGALAYTDWDKLEIIQLPTLRNDKGFTVRRAELAGTMHMPLCFAMDPTQDLVVLLTK